MVDKGGKAIVVEKTLHMENAFVQSIAYTSRSKPVLVETVTVEGTITVGSEGKTLIRISEDNGKTWRTKGEVGPEKKKVVGNKTYCQSRPRYYFDRRQGMQVEFVSRYEMIPDQDYSFGPDPETEPLHSRTGRTYYRISKDEGKTWGPEKQLIQKGADYDEIHWAEGIYYEKNTASLYPEITLRDGTIIFPVMFPRLDKDGKTVKFADRFGDVIWPSMTVASFRGCWREDLSDIDWEMSNHVSVPEYMSHGLEEPQIAELDGGKLMMIMRGSAAAWQVMPSVKFFCISKDGGRTWGPAVPLTYPDGSFVYSPSSFPNLFRSSKNGKVYVIANILAEATRQSDPRYPLRIAEVDQKYFWVLPETVTVIEDREERHPRFVRFSNWQRIEDRETGNPVIYMTEARIDEIIPDTEGTMILDSYRYEMKLPG